jgi:hypothetical protein
LTGWWTRKEYSEKWWAKEEGEAQEDADPKKKLTLHKLGYF